MKGKVITLDERKARQYRPMVYRLLLFLLREHADAEEVTQETFLVAISKSPKMGTVTNYGAWLRSIARNLARNYARKRGNSPLLLGDGLLALAERHFVETGSDRDDRWNARRQALTSCIHKLSPRDHGLLLRRYESGERVKQIAEELAVEPNSLSKRLERIRGSLRKCINAALKGKPGD